MRKKASHKFIISCFRVSTLASVWPTRLLGRFVPGYRQNSKAQALLSHLHGHVRSVWTSGAGICALRSVSLRLGPFCLEIKSQ
ncbi:hypothetical protein GGR57DRAFT_445030 [Xylariaceae sp. FL1272]|nr:hypothetical protein GGR57DRAFT_445030 [Xylariaceae sp. FL1272]